MTNSIVKPLIAADFESCDRDQLIEHYLPLVQYLAQHMSMKLPSHVECDDLAHAGVIGLIDAIDKFDPERGIKFRTYADFRIRGAILDSLRSLDWVPRSIRKQKKTVERAQARLEQELGRQATDDEIRAELGIPIGEYHKLMDSLRCVTLGRFLEINTSETAPDGGESPVAYIADEAAEDPFCCYQKSEIIARLAQSVSQLPEKERTVVNMYYFDELTMREIGSIMGITESRVSQVHTKAMRRMRLGLMQEPDWEEQYAEAI